MGVKNAVTNSKLEDMLEGLKRKADKIQIKANKIHKENTVAFLGGWGILIGGLLSSLPLYNVNPEVSNYVFFGSFISGIASILGSSFLLHKEDTYKNKAYLYKKEYEDSLEEYQQLKKHLYH
jgi:hypothetical protein